VVLYRQAQDLMYSVAMCGHCCITTVQMQDGPQEAVVEARVVIGADGNQSAVREAIIGVRCRL
jgi:2-polyprenyl-6-methoxyphenol hydroxylase-like FAD-dependent oxidoreductase